MDFDLELILVLATVLTGIFRYGSMLSRKSKTTEGERPWFIEWSHALFPVLLLVLVLRSFVAEPFRIPSGSMMPTLLIGDLILVDKFSYGLRLPVLHYKFFEWEEPALGDVLVFRYPRDPSVDFIKRVVGLPGDRVVYRDKELEINGQAYPKSHPKEFINQLLGVPKPYHTQYTEKLEDRTHRILTDAQYPSQTLEFEVPKGHYLVMGDNRDHSSDSRVWGFVPESHLVGRAFFVWMNYDFLLASLTRSGVSFVDRLGSID